MSDDPGRIVVDGRRRLFESPEFQQARDRIIDEAEAHFAPAMQTVGLLGKLRLRREKRRWIREHLESLAPSDALYLQEPRGE